MSNNRREFLKMSGILGAASVLTGTRTIANNLSANKATCVLIPTETAGPFPLDLTENTNFLRSDIRESKTGVPLRVKLRIIGDQNCEPMTNVRVNIWHCDKDGLYSGYDQTNNAGQKGLTYLRGYQFADANGYVTFMTIFPGWYSGRIAHIHFQVYVSSAYAAISQLTFPIETKQSLYQANASLYTKGTDPMSLSSDNIFSDGYQYQMGTLTPDSSIGGYETYLEVTVKGEGTVGMGYEEKLNQSQFISKPVFPNPYQTNVQLPLHLKFNSEITLELFDLQGKKVADVVDGRYAAGDHLLQFNPLALGLPVQNYVYRLRVVNGNGSFGESKMITAQ